MDDYSTRKNQLLKELAEHTGLKITVEEDGQQDAAHMLSVLDALCEPYRVQQDNDRFWLSLIRGDLSEKQILNGLARYHMTEDNPCAVYLVYFPQGCDETSAAVLANLSGPGDHVISVDEDHIALLRIFAGAIGLERMNEIALAVADTLIADAMVPVHVSYDACLDKLTDLPESFMHVTTTETCGLLFSGSESVHGYHNLGLGKIVTRLSYDDCSEYINEHLGSFRFASLDSELSTTINAFFETGLSMAKTARRLFIHRNTLVYRLEKFEKLSGLDLRNFDDAVTARLAMLMEMYVG